jgi:cell division protein FtsX
MLSVSQRVRASLKPNKKVFWSAVGILSVLLCLMTQFVLTSYVLYEWNKSRDRLEATVFVQSGLSDKERRLVRDEISRLSPNAELESVDAREVLKGKLEGVITDSKNLPEVLIVRFSGQENVGELSAVLDKIKLVPKVIAAAADLEWFQARKTLSRAVFTGAGVLAIPLLVLSVLVLAQSVARIETLFSKEIAVLKMLGAKGSIVWGPSVVMTALSVGYAAVFGSVFFFMTFFAGVPVLTEGLGVSLPINFSVLLAFLSGTAGVFFVLSMGFLAFEIYRNEPERF